MTEFAIYYKLLGVHVHMRVFAGDPYCSNGLCGELVMREGEFEDFKKLQCHYVKFMDEGKDDDQA